MFARMDLWTGLERLRAKDQINQVTSKSEDLIGDILMSSYISYRKSLSVLTEEGTGFRVEPAFKRYYSLK